MLWTPQLIVELQEKSLKVVSCCQTQRKQKSFKRLILLLNDKNFFFLLFLFFFFSSKFLSFFGLGKSRNVSIIFSTMTITLWRHRLDCCSKLRFFSTNGRNSSDNSSLSDKMGLGSSIVKKLKGIQSKQGWTWKGQMWKV